MIIYICLSIISVIVSAFVFHPHLLLFPASAVPFAFFVITIIEILIFKKKSKNDDYKRLDNTAYSLNEIDTKAIENNRHHIYIIKSLSLPCFLVFVFFFIPSKKIICSVFLYFVTYVCARLYTEIERRIKK